MYFQMEDEELDVFTKLADEKGEISKHNLIVQTKQSSFWKGNMDLKSKPSGHTTKVIIPAGGRFNYQLAGIYGSVGAAVAQLSIALLRLQVPRGRGAA
jgi:hypothetical protein